MNRIGRTGVFAAALLMGVSSAAMVASAQGQTPPSFSWTGIHFGGGGGFGVANHNVGFSLYEYLDLPYEPATPSQDIIAFGGTFDFGGTGDFWTAAAGLDVRLGRFVFGAGGDYTGSEMTTELNLAAEVCYEDDINPDSCDVGAVDDEVFANLIIHSGEAWTVWGRAGFLATPRTLFYGLFGRSWNSVSVEANLEALGVPDGFVEFASEPTWVPGIIFGAGVETYIFEHVTLGLEYRGTRYSLGDGVEIEDSDFGLDVFDNYMNHTIRGTLALRFGPDGGAVTDESFGPDRTNWTGIYLGAGGGYGFSNHYASAFGYDYTLGGLFAVGGVDVFSIGGGVDVGGQGGLLTVGGGFDIQLGNRGVLGAFGDFTHSGIGPMITGFWTVCEDVDTDPVGSCDVVGEPFPEIDGAFEAGIRMGNQWTIGGRFGVLTGPRTLVYGMAGFTQAELVAWFEAYPGDAEPFGGETVFERSAVSFGAGVESLLTNNLSIFLEYRGTLWNMDDEIPTSPDTGFGYGMSNYVQTVRAGINWRPGGNAN